MAKKDKRMWIDGVMGSELMDTQGETLSVEGADISELEAGRGRWNDNHGKGFFNSLGTITKAKKILKEEDCENERHEYYWNKIKAPYIYGVGFLHNDEDHPNAKAAAAIIRNIHKHDSPLKVKLSVEGGVLARGIKDSARLARTKIHSCAITFTPANNATLVEPLNLDKSNTDWEADKQLIKSVMHLAETNVPSFRHISRHASANTIHDNILKIQELAKSLGIDITVNESNPESIMKNAVFHKVSDNVNKINKLVKALGGTAVRQTADATRMKTGERQDSFQQGIKQIRSEAAATSNRPMDASLNAPKSDTVKMTKPTDFKHNITLKSHAKKASENPAHLKGIYSQIKDVHGHDKAKAVIDKIRSHMTKSEDMEKGEVVRAGKNLIIAGALAVGANSFSPKKTAPKQTKQEQAKELEDKRQAHNSKIKDPGMKVGPVEGYNQMEPNAKAKYNERRKKLKSGLKKALTAGYGGAGAPGAMTGGSVIQSESLDDGRTKKSETTDGFTYISCNDCGHEQVYMKHQVKCRKCKKNFSLDKLQGHM